PQLGRIQVGEERERRQRVGQLFLAAQPYVTARQVTVLKTPSIFWMFSTMIPPIALTSSPSSRAITSYSPVMASATVMPRVSCNFLATSIALPGEVLIST